MTGSKEETKKETEEERAERRRKRDEEEEKNAKIVDRFFIKYSQTKSWEHADWKFVEFRAFEELLARVDGILAKTIKDPRMFTSIMYCTKQR